MNFLAMNSLSSTYAETEQKMYHGDTVQKPARKQGDTLRKGPSAPRFGKSVPDIALAYARAFALPDHQRLHCTAR